MTEHAEEWVVEPRLPSLLARAAETWRYRHLLRFFAGRALEKLYRRTVLGRAWLIIRPVVPVVIATVIFGQLIKIDSEGVPYTLFVLVGMSIWQLFSGCLTWGTRSLELHRKTLKRLYFPRLLLPLATLSPALFNFGINGVFIAIAAVYYFARTGTLYFNGTLGLLATLAATLLCITFALGIVFWTSVWGTTARDVRFTLAYVVDFWYFLTPVFYPPSLVPEPWRSLAALNPMAVIVETFRWGLLGIGQPRFLPLLVAVVLIGGTFVLGLLYFSRAEADSVDKL